MSQPLEFEGHEIIPTASVGIVTGDGKPRTAAELFRDADTAMYRAKAAGKNRCAIFDETMHSSAVAQLPLESDLRHAVARKELLLNYQPIVSLASKELVGFEALIRWRRDGKTISPADFIPVAEDTGLIVPIGEWVLEEACRCLAGWREKHLDHPGIQALSMSINVLRKQLFDPNFVTTFQRVMRETGLEPGSVKLEITESVIMEDGQGACKAMAALREIGATVVDG